MKSNKILLISAICAFIIGVGSVVLFKSLEKDTGTQQPAAQPTTQNEDADDTKKADAIAEEGQKLMLTDPLKAHDTFIEAQKAYLEAGDEAKASEMETNALAAKAHHTLDPEYPSTTTRTPEPSSGPADPVGVE